MEPTARAAMHFARMKGSYPALKCDWLAECIGIGMEKIYKCFTAETSSDRRKIIWLDYELIDIHNASAELCSLLITYKYRKV